MAAPLGWRSILEVRTVLFAAASCTIANREEFYRPIFCFNGSPLKQRLSLRYSSIA
jgi:hypothetical protein